MSNLKEKPILKQPDYYRNPTGIGSYTALANDVRKGRGDIILTTEYVQSERFVSGILYFEKLTNSFTYQTIDYGWSQGLGIIGIYIKGIITWTDGTQSSFSTISNITIEDQVIQLTLNPYYARTPVKATLRISQL